MNKEWDYKSNGPVEWQVFNWKTKPLEVIFSGASFSEASEFARTAKSEDCDPVIHTNNSNTSVGFELTPRGLRICGDHTLTREDVCDLTQRLFDILRKGSKNGF